MKKEAKIGIFAVTMILCAWAGIRFLSGIDIFSRNVNYYAAYTEVGGVQPATPVMMRGVKIGTVTEIIFPSTESREVVLCLRVKKQYRLPEDSEARLVSSLMGGMTVELTPGSSAVALERGDTLRSFMEPDMLDAVAENIDPMVEQLEHTLGELNAVLEGVHAVIDNNATNIESLMTHLESITSNLDRVLGGQQGNLEQAVEGLAQFSATLGENSERIDTMVGDLSQFTASLSEAELVEHLDGTLDELEQLLGQMQAGEGSMGKLIADPELYANLTQASENLSTLLADLQENPGRYVHISVFGVNEERQAAKQAKKEAKALKKEAKAAKKAE